MSHENLLLSQCLDKKPLDSVSHCDLREIDNNTHNSLLYLSNSILEGMHPRLTQMSVKDVQKYLAEQRQIRPACRNQMINRMWSYFDHEKPIDHIFLIKLSGIDVSDPDKARRECKKVLIRAGVKVGFIFGLEKGNNGIWHFHAIVQGYLKPHQYVLKRTGWGYIKAPEDRKEYFNIDEDNPNRIRGFHATVKYCLEKHHPNKKNYLKISS